MKRITLEKLEMTSVVITKEEQLWIKDFLIKMKVFEIDETVIYKIFQMAKIFSNEIYETKDLFLNGFNIYEKQLPTKSNFNKLEKWEEQLLWRIRMKILEIQ